MDPDTERALAQAIEDGRAPSIRRSEVVNRARTIHPADTVPYSMDAWCNHGYRNDCSGKVSEWFGIPIDASGSWRGLNTVTMVTHGPVPGVAWFSRIPASDLRPGDVVGIMGPGTSGAAGHVRLFEDWVTHDNDADNRYWAWEQAGGMGPDRRMYDDLAEAGRGGRYLAYRYVGILEDPLPAPAPAPVLYTIVSGDTMTSIAARLGVPVAELIERNRAVLDAAARARGFTDSDGGNRIWPGTVITTGQVIIHTVAPGDTLGAIAARYQVSADQVYAINATTIEAAAKARGRADSRGGPNNTPGWWIYPGTPLIIRK